MEQDNTTIMPPQGAHPLSAAELNNVRFSTKHTVLTPEVVARLSAKQSAK